ncbi:L,D-transpeptidase [bacterium]|nr:L,D-transpeptidase [bacterium]
MTLPPNWSQPFGWVLDTTGIYASLVPGGESTSESGLIPLHYERYNIFAEEVDSEGWKWYLVGPNQWVKQVYMAVIQPTERPEGVTGRWTAVDLFEQTLVAYEGDTPVFATLISTGLPGTETNEGLFDVWAAVPTDTMSGATGAPNAYALQSVPWVMYFDGSISLHGTYWHDTFGYRRSRGCVNLSISDARWMFNFLKDSPQTNDKGEPLMLVYVHSTGEYREGDNK